MQQIERKAFSIRSAKYLYSHVARDFKKVGEWVKKRTPAMERPSYVVGLARAPAMCLNAMNFIAPNRPKQHQNNPANRPSI